MNDIIITVMILNSSFDLFQQASQNIIWRYEMIHLCVKLVSIVCSHSPTRLFPQAVSSSLLLEAATYSAKINLISEKNPKQYLPPRFPEGNRWDAKWEATQMPIAIFYFTPTKHKTDVSTLYTPLHGCLASPHIQSAKICTVPIWYPKGNCKR